MSKFSPAGRAMPAGDEYDEAGDAFDNEFNTEANLDDDNHELAATGAPLGNEYEDDVVVGEQQPTYASGGSMSEVVATLKEQNVLLSQLVMMQSQSDSHKRSLKAMASGSRNITVTANVHLQSTLQELAANPSMACLKIPSSIFNHTSGTLLEVALTTGSQTFPVSWLVHTKGIANLAPPSVGSPAGEKGVCYIKAKTPTIPYTSIISSNESDAVREFQETYPGITADNVMKGIIENPETDERGEPVLNENGKPKMKYMTPRNHPITDLILTKKEKLGLKPEEFYSALGKKYHFDEADVNLAANEIRNKLTKESTAVSLDNISFPLTRGVLSEKAKADSSAQSWRMKMLDAFEMPSHIKSNNTDAELTKSHSIHATFVITYSPAPNSEKNAEKK